MRALNIGFWIDALETLRPRHDSSLTLMAEATARVHRVFCFETKDISVERGVCRLKARAVHVSQDTDKATVLADVPLQIDELDLLFLRRDPPVDAAYAHATRLLEQGAAWPHPHFVNAPASLRDLNEKLLALRYPELTPRTVVTSNPEVLASARRSLGAVVIKPMDGCGGVDIFRLRPEDDAEDAWAKVTAGGTLPAIVQQYLPAAKDGDKRILVWNGRPLGAILRVAKQGEFRCNFAAGGRPVKTGMDARDLLICERVRPFLLEAGLQLVGLDVIGGMLTEINVTSPTGICEINAANGDRLQTRIMDDCERMVARARQQEQPASLMH